MVLKKYICESCKTEIQLAERRDLCPICYGELKRLTGDSKDKFKVRGAN